MTVDGGCALALTRRGKSLLPGGVTGVSGSFAAGAPIEIYDQQGQELAVGLSNYSSTEIEKIMGRPSRQLSARLGYCHSDEIVPRDNMVLSEDLI